MTEHETVSIPGPSIRVSGEYKFVLNSGTPKEADSGWMPNLVTDLGLDMLGSSAIGLGAGQDPTAWLSVGTGTTTPANSDTGLVTYLASINGRTTVSQVNLGSTTYAGQLTLSWTFAQGAVVGNLAEVGVGRSSGGTNLFSRARIVDGAGVPTTLTVVALDQLTVYYRITNTPVKTDLVSSVVISGVTYNYTCRLANATNFMMSNIQYMYSSSPRWPGTGTTITFYETGSAIGAITSNPSGTIVSNAQYDTETFGTYTNGNFYNDITLTWGPTKANPVAAIQSMMLHFGNSFGNWQWVFTTTIPKTNTKTLTLVVRVSWSR